MTLTLKSQRATPFEESLHNFHKTYQLRMLKVFQIFTEEHASFYMWFFPPWQGAEASKGPQDP